MPAVAHHLGPDAALVTIGVHPASPLRQTRVV
jgi:hypothetical protein